MSSIYQRRRRSVKAYKDLSFLNSPDARLVRILSEYLEPQARFRKNGIRDTIVFFGSARVTPRKEALEALDTARREVSRVRRPTKRLLQNLRYAQTQVEMSRYYEDTVELARLITEWGRKVNSSHRFVVCSGGGPGIMEAANKGARLAGGKTIGLNISLPFEQTTNRYVSDGLNFEFHYFFMRKFWFAYLAKALVIFPGGFGTMDELMEILTLLQTGKIRKKMSVVIYGSEYWNKVLNLDEMVRYGVITKQDLSLFRFMDTPKDAFAYLKECLLRNYPAEH